MHVGVPGEPRNMEESNTTVSGSDTVIENCTVISGLVQALILYTYFSSNFSKFLPRPSPQGNVAQTRGGGTSVTFTGVETHRQQSVPPTSKSKGVRSSARWGRGGKREREGRREGGRGD